MFLPVNGDPYRNNVVLHVPMTGANDSTTFTDVSPSPKTITVNGDTKISTAQSKWGNGSGYFDGTGDYLTTPNHADFNFGTGDFTIEAWTYRLSYAQNYEIVSYGSPGSTGFGLGSDSTQLVFLASNVGARVSTTTLPALNTWVHIAVTRASGVYRLFFSGVVISTSGATSDNLDATTIFRIAVNRALTSITTGYMQDLRITKGVARYTADFAPPSGPLPSRLPELPVQRSIQQPSFHQIARVGL
jgi:hypothetical protein